MDEQQQLISFPNAPSHLQREMGQKLESWKKKDITWIPPSVLACSNNNGDIVVRLDDKHHHHHVDHDDDRIVRHAHTDLEEDEEEWEEEDYSARKYDEDETDTDESEEDEMHSDVEWHPSRSSNMMMLDNLVDGIFREDDSVSYAHSRLQKERQQHADVDTLERSGSSLGKSMSSLGKSMSTLTTEATTIADSQGSFHLSMQSPLQRELARALPYNPEKVRCCLVSPLADPSPGPGRRRHKQVQKTKKSRHSETQQKVEQNGSTGVQFTHSPHSNSGSRKHRNHPISPHRRRARRDSMNNRAGDFNYETATPHRQSQRRGSLDTAMPMSARSIRRGSMGNRGEDCNSETATPHRQSQRRGSLDTSTPISARSARRGSMNNRGDDYNSEAATPHRQSQRRGSLDTVTPISARSTMSNRGDNYNFVTSTPHRQSQRRSSLDTATPMSARSLRRGSMGNKGEDYNSETATPHSQSQRRGSLDTATPMSVRSGSRRVQSRRSPAKSKSTPLMSAKERVPTPVRRKPKLAMRRNVSGGSTPSSSTSSHHQLQQRPGQQSIDTNVDMTKVAPPEAPSSPTSRTASFSSHGSSSHGSTPVSAHFPRASAGQTSLLETVGELPFLGAEDQRRTTIQQERISATHHSSGAYTYQKPTRTVNVFM